MTVPLSCLIPAFKNYDLISAKSANLTRLVKEWKTFVLEDSVQRLAKLSEPELLVFIDKIIENVRKEEELKRQQEQERLLNEQYGIEVGSECPCPGGSDSRSKVVFL